MVLATEKDNLGKIAEWAVDNKLAYACCLSHLGEKMHDLIDETYVYREMKLIEGISPDILPITTWHPSIHEGLDFALYTANHPDTSIEHIICFGKFAENEFVQLLENIDTE